MSADLTVQALEYARAAHGSISQKRKYSGEPYIVHPIAVARTLQELGEKDEEVIRAAYLHDVLEDVWPLNRIYRPDAIQTLFGDGVLALVKELTDEFTKESYPALNREDRKKLEAQRIATISDRALRIKLADMIDNTQDVMKHDRGFGHIYLREKENILDCIYPRTMDSKDSILLTLYHRAKAQISYYKHA